MVVIFFWHKYFSRFYNWLNTPLNKNEGNSGNVSEKSKKMPGKFESELIDIVSEEFSTENDDIFDESSFEIIDKIDE